MQIQNQGHQHGVVRQNPFGAMKENLKNRPQEGAVLEDRCCRWKTWIHHFQQNSGATNLESPRGFRRKIHPSSAEIQARHWSRNLEFRQKSRENR